MAEDAAARIIRTTNAIVIEKHLFRVIVNFFEDLKRELGISDGISDGSILI